VIHTTIQKAKVYAFVKTVQAAMDAPEYMSLDEAIAAAREAAGDMMDAAQLVEGELAARLAVKQAKEEQLSQAERAQGVE
jgi:hypothetical protein